MKKILVCFIVLTVLSSFSSAMGLKEEWSMNIQYNYLTFSEKGNYFGIIDSHQYKIFNNQGKIIREGKNLWKSSRIMVSDQSFGINDTNAVWRFFSYNGNLLWRIQNSGWPKYSLTGKYILLTGEDDISYIYSREGELQYVFDFNYYECDFLLNDKYLVNGEGVYELKFDELDLKLKSNSYTRVSVLNQGKNFITNFIDYTNPGQSVVTMYSNDFSKKWQHVYDNIFTVVTTNEYFFAVNQERLKIYDLEGELIQKLDFTPQMINPENLIMLERNLILLHLYDEDNNYVVFIDLNGNILYERAFVKEASVRLGSENSLYYINKSNSSITKYKIEI